MSIRLRNNVSVRGRGDLDMIFARGYGCDQNMWRLLTPAFEDPFSHHPTAPSMSAGSHERWVPGSTGGAPAADVRRERPIVSARAHGCAMFALPGKSRAPAQPTEKETMTDKAHWESVYGQKSASDVSWYQPHLQQSLMLIAQAELPAAASIVDVGGGASTLVDDLLAQGFTNITVIDLARSALAQSQERLGAGAKSVRWIEGDVTTELLAPESVDLWHDRAVFHFLTDASRRSAYLEQVERCVRPRKFVVLSTFAPDGPERCSGLPVARYSPDELADALGPAFVKVAEAREHHTSPSGNQQSFSYVLCRRR